MNGAGSELGKAAVAAIHKARGMEVAGALDSKYQGQDAGEVAGLAESLEIPILNDIVMVLGSLSQGTSMGVFVDLDDPAAVYENVRQATAFGLKSVVGVPGLGMDKVGALSSFCEKASTVSNGVYCGPFFVDWRGAAPTSCSVRSFSVQTC